MAERHKAGSCKDKKANMSVSTGPLFTCILYPFNTRAWGQLCKNNLRKIAIIFLSNSLNICSGCSKELSQVLLSTHYICFG